MGFASGESKQKVFAVSPATQKVAAYHCLGQGFRFRPAEIRMKKYSAESRAAHPKQSSRCQWTIWNGNRDTSDLAGIQTVCRSCKMPEGEFLAVRDHPKRRDFDPRCHPRQAQYAAYKVRPVLPGFWGTAQELGS